MKLLIQALYDCSTNNFARYFPVPLNLYKVSEKNGYIIDLNLMAFDKDKKQSKNKEYKKNAIEWAAKFINENYTNYEEVIINCGEYAPDGYYHEWFEMLLDKIEQPVSIMGSYASVFKNRIRERYGDRIMIKDFDYDVHNIVVPVEKLKLYPVVGKETKAIKANLQGTSGCIRQCSMCPVAIIHKGKHVHHDNLETLNVIKHYYNNGVRFFNFIDDNIAAVNSKFIDLLKLLENEDLKGAKFQAQEGFEVRAFLNDEFCELLKKNNFDDIKIGIENIKPDFRESINKTFFSTDEIDQAINNAKKHGLKLKAFFLISPEMTYEDVIDNLKYLSSHLLPIRVNKIREYENSEYSLKEKKQNLTDKEMDELVSLANAINQVVQDKKIDIFSTGGLEKLQLKCGIKVTVTNTHITVNGKRNDYGDFSFKKVLKFMLENRFKTKLKLTVNKENFLEYIKAEPTISTAA